MQLLAQVRRFVRQHDLMRPATRVVVALSGGSDSVALALLLHDLDAAGELSVAGAAHFNHQLRAEADRDEQYAVDLGRSLGWRIVVDRADVASMARRERRSVEDAARTARHAFLERARLELGADVIALGHTRDDQAETFLLRVVRGAGPRGLAAMYPRRGAVVRPLLDCRRADLRAWLEARGVGWFDDASNDDVGVPRNRVRAELLPLLERRFNPQIVDALAHEAALARDDWQCMEVAGQAAFDAVCRCSTGGAGEVSCELDVARLDGLLPALRRFVLWRAMSRAAGRRAVTFAHAESAMDAVAMGAADTAIDLPGHRLERIGPRVVLRGRPPGAVGRLGRPAANLFRYPLSIPGEVSHAEGGWVVSAECPSQNGADASDPATAVVPRALCGGPLVVRNRRPGDRFRPVGVGGWKKLQDFFVDRKVARDTRDQVPLVVDAEDRIVWVVGYGLDEAFRVTDRTQTVVILRFKVVGGLA